MTISRLMLPNDSKTILKQFLRKPNQNPTRHKTPLSTWPDQHPRAFLSKALRVWFQRCWCMAEWHTWSWEQAGNGYFRAGFVAELFLEEPFPSGRAGLSQAVLPLSPVCCHREWGPAQPAALTLSAVYCKSGRAQTAVWKKKYIYTVESDNLQSDFYTGLELDVFMGKCFITYLKLLYLYSWAMLWIYHVLKQWDVHKYNSLVIGYKQEESFLLNWTANQVFKI